MIPTIEAGKAKVPSPFVEKSKGLIESDIGRNQVANGRNTRAS